MSEYYAVIRTTDHLAHYGVIGMKWGVRRYLDKDGNLTKHAYKRYGNNPSKSTSPRRMTRDYNELDRMYANTRADKIDVNNGIKFGSVTAKERIGMDKMPKDEQIRILNNQMKGMKTLQGSIMNTAKNNNYSYKVKSKQRAGKSTRDLLAARFNDYGYISQYGYANNPEKYYSGSQVKFKRPKKRR